MEGFIEQNRWQSFLDDFSKRNQFRATRVEVLGDEIGAQEEEDSLPLVGVSLEKKGSEAGSVVVLLGGESANDMRHIEHRIENVQHIAPLVGEANGLEQGIGFEDGDGGRTLLLLEELPELPDNA